MKRIFGFLAGAGLGAAVLYAARKFLGNNDSPAEQPAWPAPSSSGVTTLSQTSNKPESEVESVEDLPAYQESAGNHSIYQENVDFNSATQEVNLAEEKTSNSLSDETSLVGEPEGRHLEPLAATNTDAKTISPRSETTETSVPEAVEVMVPAEFNVTELEASEEVDFTASAEAEEVFNVKAPAEGTYNDVKSFDGNEGPDVKAPANTPPLNQPATTSPNQTSQASTHDNFTPIYGIGEAYNKRLHKAGIHTFAMLASMTPEEIEQKTEIALDVIIKDDWCAQASRLVKDS